jgi:TRAP-type C4-dicarboxylate transport system permease small subunit
MCLRIHDPAHTAAVYKALIEVAVLVLFGAIVFFGYLLWRPRINSLSTA